MDGIGNLAGWRWIFILEGMATILIALISWWTMPADLSSAKFFTDEEREFASESPSPLLWLQRQLACSLAIPRRPFRRRWRAPV